jgi:hypothetical protein
MLPTDATHGRPDRLILFAAGALPSLNVALFWVMRFTGGRMGMHRC